jgi:hypothetical protein
MNITLLFGTALFLIGIVLAVIGMANVGADAARPLIETTRNTSIPMMESLQAWAVPALAGLCLVAGGLLMGLSLGNWQHPRTKLEPGDEVVNPEGHHKMKHV